jgi:hypothetical protein
MTRPNLSDRRLHELESSYATTAAEVGRALGAPTYPHLILSYSAYIGHLTMGVLGYPLYIVGAIRRAHRYHNRLSIINGIFKGS